MRWIVLLAGLAACSPAVAPPAEKAAPVEAPAPKLIDKFDPELIIRLVGPMDYKVGKRVEDSPDANASIELLGPEGETFIAEERHCASHTPGITCAGITLTGRISVDPKSKFDRLDYVNDFNQDQAAVAMFADGGDVVVSDDVILNGGVSEANLEASLATFVTVLRQNRDFLLRATGAKE